MSIINGGIDIYTSTIQLKENIGISNSGVIAIVGQDGIIWMTRRLHLLPVQNSQRKKHFLTFFKIPYTVLLSNGKDNYERNERENFRCC